MFGKLFEDVVGAVTDTAKIVVAPVAVTANLEGQVRQQMPFIPERDFLPLGYVRVHRRFPLKF